MESVTADKGQWLSVQFRGSKEGYLTFVIQSNVLRNIRKGLAIDLWNEFRGSTHLINLVINLWLM
jgi:hypothetical protein